MSSTQIIISHDEAREIYHALQCLGKSPETNHIMHRLEPLALIPSFSVMDDQGIHELAVFKTVAVGDDPVLDDYMIGFEIKDAMEEKLLATIVINENEAERLCGNIRHFISNKEINDRLAPLAEQTRKIHIDNMQKQEACDQKEKDISSAACSNNAITATKYSNTKNLPCTK